jgi:hypothetical protein
MKSNIAESTLKQIFKQSCIEKGCNIDIITQFIEMYNLNIDSKISKSTWLISSKDAIMNKSVIDPTELGGNSETNSSIKMCLSVIGDTLKLGYPFDGYIININLPNFGMSLRIDLTSNKYAVGPLE